MAPITWVL